MGDRQMQFQGISPSTEVACCSGKCSDQPEITWKIYRESINRSLDNRTNWIPFDQTDLQDKRFSFSKDRRRAISQ